MIAKKRKMQKGKMVVWGGLTNSWEKKRSERQRRKGKIYPFECRVPKNNKEKQEVVLSDQCKEIEENNRVGKSRDHFKKIRDIKGTFSYCSWGSQGKNTEVVCHSLLQWTTFYQTSPPWPDCLGWPHRAWLSFIELDKAVVPVIRLTSFLWLWFQCVCPLMPPHTYHLT